MNTIYRQVSVTCGGYLHRIRSAWNSLDDDEDGLSTVEMLLLLFIGVVIIIAIIAYFWGTIWPAIKGIIDDLFAQNQN